jgi:PBP1b-binding outer membrane lipoprotein LpoB
MLKARYCCRLMLLLLVTSMLYACSTGVSKRVDLDAELVGDAQATSVQDYRTVADQMARSLIQLPMIHKAESPPTIASEGFQEKIRTLLIKNCMGKIYFLDRAAINEILEERKMEQVGMTTAGRSTGKMYGADYFLAGSIHSINRIQGTQKTAYTRYSFRLTDADTSLIVWEDEYETRYFKEKAFWDQ